MSVIVNGLTKVFDGQTVVDDISFEARSGEILGFLGPNGAGKSTTIKMICCYMPPTSGTASVNGYDIHANPLSVRKQIGYLPEHNPLYEEMYVKEFLQFVASIHKIQNKKARIDEVIEATGLVKEQNKVIGTLSKGYRQRVGLAQAIIHDSDVLILDEPTSGLDMNQLVDIRNLIKSLGQQKTVIFSSHIMQEVQALCDRVVIINEGQKVADESIEKLTSMLSGNQHVIVEFANKNINTLGYKSIKGLNEVYADGNKWMFSAEKDIDIRPFIFQHAASTGDVIIEMRQERANIEDIFRKLTKSTVNA